MLQRKYIETLFDPRESIVLGRTKFDIQAVNLGNVAPTIKGAQFVTLNPMKEGTTRADKNVAVYRNFLVEFDELELSDQTKYIQDMEVPYSSWVFSGSKSYHLVISLEDPVETKKEYDALVRWIYKALPECDPSCKNPSRFTRLGQGINSKTKDIQNIVDLKPRVTQERLKAWLSNHCGEPLLNKCHENFTGKSISMSTGRIQPHPATLGFIKTGGRRGHRQKNIYIAACDLRDCGYSLEEAKFMLLNKIQQVYNKEGRDSTELEIKARAIVDAFNKGGE